MSCDSHSGDIAEKNVLAGIDPAIKLVCLAILTAAFIFADSLLGHILTAVFLAALFYLAQIAPAAVKSSVGRLLPLLLFVCMLDFCFYSPETAFYSLWIFTPSVNGVLRGIGTAAKIVEIAVLFDLLRCLTEPMSLGAPLTVILRPLTVLGVSPNRIALTVASSFLFYDLFRKKLDEIWEIQKNKGIQRWEKRRRFDSAAKLRLLRPALYYALCEVKERAVVLESRGMAENFGKICQNRTELSIYDYCAVTVSIAFFAVQLIIL